MRERDHYRKRGENAVVREIITERENAVVRERDHYRKRGENAVERGRSLQKERRELSRLRDH